MFLILIVVALCTSHSYAENNIKSTNSTKQPIGCVCGVFLSGQFTKGSKEQPKGFPLLVHEYPDPLPCTIAGNKLCTSKCVEAVSVYIEVFKIITSLSIQ